MASKINNRIKEYEDKGRQEFIKYLGNKYSKIWAPKDIYSPFDLICTHIEGDTHIFELKYTNKYFISSFPEAMIDVKKWKSLTKLTSENPYVFYMRMYADGYAIWHINSLTTQDWSVGNYERKAVTVSDSNKTKSDCILINFDAAIKIHKKTITNSKIPQTTLEQLVKFQDQQYNDEIKKYNIYLK